MKIINHLRLSEDEIPLPLSNGLKLGELLQREKRGTIVGGGAISGASPQKVSGFENEALRFIPTNEDLVKSKSQLDGHIEDENTRLQKMSSGLIKRCLVAANAIAQINKDGLFSSLLNQWFMRYKSQKPPSFLVQETDHVIQFETRIFNSIRQSNIQSQNRKQFKTVLFEIKQLRDDIRKLFEYM
jgi:hypothetical protein